MVRVYSKEHSPSSTGGWYIAYLFAAGGSAVYACLTQGSTDHVNGAYVPKPTSELVGRATWARQYLAGSIEDPEALKDIHLGAAGSLGRAYEQSNVIAFRYARGSVPDDDHLADHLGVLVSGMLKLYESAPPPAIIGDDSPAAARSGRIPPTTRERVVEALRAFDDSERGTPEWRGWEDRPQHKYAISFHDRVYPVKRIVTLASGLPDTSGFSGGGEANRYVRRLGFEIVPLRSTARAVSGTGRRAWIFQNNPDVWDLGAALKDAPEFTWSVRQHAADIRPDDIAYVWEAGPRGASSP